MHARRVSLPTMSHILSLLVSEMALLAEINLLVPDMVVLHILGVMPLNSLRVWWIELRY
jgi:hypothetical protein